MLQNKLLFNQSSVSLEIIGLPDYSNNENKEQISIISQWKLMIINKPLIEGNIDHLGLIMEAFYNYSNFLINNEEPLYESNLIDIKADNFFTHNILLKSSKSDVDPLNIKIGNSVLSDIINCFDQLNSSKKIREINLKIIKNPKRHLLNLINKDKILRIFLPPTLSLCSLFLVSFTFIYFYNFDEDKKNNSLINSKIILNSIKSINKVV